MGFQVCQVCLECLRLTLDLLVTIFKSRDEFSQIRHWHLKLLAVITLIICQIVDLLRCVQWLGNFPGSIVTGEVVDLGAATIPLHIR